MKDEFSDAGQLKRRKHLLRGEILHDILSRVGNLSSCDKELSLKESLSKTKFKFPFLKDLKAEEASLRKLLDEKLLKAFFYCPEADVFQEKEVLDDRGNAKRIDRLIVGKSQVWIVDYKSTPETSGKQTAQVREYVSLLSDIYPDRTIKGYLVYLDTATFEEVI